MEWCGGGVVGCRAAVRKRLELGWEDTSEFAGSVFYGL